MSQLKINYIGWLAATALQDVSPCYNRLLDHLHHREFTCFVPNDDNRGEDGKQLREVFMQLGEKRVNIRSVPTTQSCTVLEMLVALAIRMENIMAKSNTQDNVYIWFQIMLGNLGIKGFTNAVYEQTERAELEVDRIIDQLLARTYQPSGKGGLFPLSQGEKDQRKVEIWYQMMDYIAENFEI